MVKQKADCLKYNERIRSDEGLTLETSAFESLYGGQFTLLTQLIKPNYLEYLFCYFHCSTILQVTRNTAAQ